MAFNYRQGPGAAPQLGGGQLPPGYGYAPPPASYPPYSYDSRQGLADPRYPNHPQMGQIGQAPSYCQMQDYLNPGGPAVGSGPGWPNRAGAAPPMHSGGPGAGWSQPQLGGDFLPGRGNPAADNLYGRAAGPGVPAPYSAWHQNSPTPPRERKCDPAPAGLIPAPDNSWEILSEEAGWQAWNPGIVFYGVAGEELEFTLGAFLFRVVFDSNNSGYQSNLTTGRRRNLRRRVPPSGGLARDALAGGQLADPLYAPRSISLAELRGQPPPELPSPPRAPAAHPAAPPPYRSDSAAAYDQPRAADSRGAVDSAAAYDQAAEAYREFQKIGQPRAAPELPETPVIVLGDAGNWSGPSGVAPEALGSAAGAAADAGAGATEMDVFGLLENLQSQLQQLDKKVDVTLEALEEEAITLSKARDNLAQLEAKLNNVQCKGIDALELDRLPPEEVDEARALRKELTRKADRLQSRLDKIFAVIVAKLAV